MSKANETTDHTVIKEWAEKRHGKPAKIKDTGDGKDEGILRIHFPEASQVNENFQEITWKDFFKNFEENQLLFLYQDKKDNGDYSTFHKFIHKDNNN
jgi:hypothetical protein